ncbi:MAG: hypothetical protein ACYDCQ_14510 [Dehalococcoidia bacterium]
MTTRTAALPRELFVDTGAFYATTDERDQWHAATVRFSARLAGSTARLYTTNFISENG